MQAPLVIGLPPRKLHMQGYEAEDHHWPSIPWDGILETISYFVNPQI